jgi:hypothetical protein
MAKTTKAEAGAVLGDKRQRSFPKHSLEAALVLPQKIQDEGAGKPMNRLLLADALDISPSSSNLRDLLSSANKYGLIQGNEKSEMIGLTPLGDAATKRNDAATRLQALRRAALQPPIFASFFGDYASRKMPSAEMLPKILRTQYSVPADLADASAKILQANGAFVDIVREISGSPHVLLDAETVTRVPVAEEGEESPPEAAPDAVAATGTPLHLIEGARPPSPAAGAATESGSSLAPKPIFVGHGKNKQPLQQLQALLAAFQIPHKVVVDEANLGRPISQKVKETIQQCGSAILIFTRDEKFLNEAGAEVWRPSENVIHELGATSFVYGDRIVIFKEKGLNLPSNFQNIGYIEFDGDGIQARTAELLKELIGFGLVKVTPTA